jgi:hypothetical protein
VSEAAGGGEDVAGDDMDEYEDDGTGIETGGGTTAVDEVGEVRGGAVVGTGAGTEIGTGAETGTGEGTLGNGSDDDEWCTETGIGIGTGSERTGAGRGGGDGVGAMGWGTEGGEGEGEW